MRDRDESMSVMFFLSVMSDEHESDVVVGFMSQVPVEFVKRETMPEIDEFPTSRVYVVGMVAIPILPVVTAVIDGLPDVVAYVPVPKSIPPMLRELAVALGKEMFVPMIILFEPRLLPVNERPVLKPNKLE